MDLLQTRLTALAEELTGTGVAAAERLGGGSLSEIWRLELSDERVVIAKTGPAPRVEAAMLEAIRGAGAPAPRVFGADADVLVIEALAGGSGPAAAWADLGKALRLLHATHGDRYGWADDYAFGAVPIVNAWCGDWVDFWATHRLSGPAGALAPAVARRIEGLARGLGERVPRLPAPSLLHGDLWGGNVMVAGGAVTGLIDPACYFGDAEVDLAMLGLFDSPARTFFDAYGPLEPGFRERVAIYQLWPAIVHVRLFGAGYLPLLERLLARAGV